MNSRIASGIFYLTATFPASLLMAGGVSAQTIIDTGLFTQIDFRQCNSDTDCTVDPDNPLHIEIQSDFDLSDTGHVSTQITSDDLDAQGATSAGYDGQSLTPAMSAYAYSGGAYQYILGSWGFQKYTFLQDGTITLSGALTYTQTGEHPLSLFQNPRGMVNASLMAFQFNDNEFDASGCNRFTSFDQLNIAGVLQSCIRFNGVYLPPPIDFTVEFDGLQNVQIADFSVPSTPVANGLAQAQLVVNGQAGDVFFVAAYLSISVHLGGWADSGNTLKVEVDKPELVEPAFTEQTFEPAPTRQATVDIKPGDVENCFNINSHGVIPVAILGNAALDVRKIDPTTLSFGGLEVRVRGNKGPLCHEEYLDENQHIDLVCQFEDDPYHWAPGEGEATVLGTLLDGSKFEGSGAICIVTK